MASTILHFMAPNIYPIIDIRTVGVLFIAGQLSSQTQTGIRAYKKYLAAIDKIQQSCTTSWSLRAIDNALFTYHKEFLVPLEKAVNKYIYPKLINQLL